LLGLEWLFEIMLRRSSVQIQWTGKNLGRI